jgi:hypothetical protein
LCVADLSTTRVTRTATAKLWTSWARSTSLFSP